MDYSVLCKSLKELYGKNNDLGLFREDMTEAEKSNLLRNFEGGAAFENVKGFIPFSGHDLYKSSEGAFADILKEMKPWDRLSLKQKIEVIEFAERRNVDTLKDGGYLVRSVLINGMQNVSFARLQVEEERRGVEKLMKHDPRNLAQATREALARLKDEYVHQPDSNRQGNPVFLKAVDDLMAYALKEKENADKKQSASEVSAENNGVLKTLEAQSAATIGAAAAIAESVAQNAEAQNNGVLKTLGAQSATTIGAAAAATESVAQNAEAQNNGILKTLGEKSAPVIAASAEAMNKFAQEAASASK